MNFFQILKMSSTPGQVLMEQLLDGVVLGGGNSEMGQFWVETVVGWNSFGIVQFWIATVLRLDCFGVGHF